MNASINSSKLNPTSFFASQSQWSEIFFLMLALLRRASVWPPSMVYISVIITHIHCNLHFFLYILSRHNHQNGLCLATVVIGPSAESIPHPFKHEATTLPTTPQWSERLKLHSSCKKLTIVPLPTENQFYHLECSFFAR